MGWCAILLEPCILFVDFKGSKEVLNNNLIPHRQYALIKKERTDNILVGNCTQNSKFLKVQLTFHCLQTIIESWGHLHTHLNTPTLHLWKMWCRGCAYHYEWRFGTTGKNKVIFRNRLVSTLDGTRCGRGKGANHPTYMWSEFFNW